MELAVAPRQLVIFDGREDIWYQQLDLGIIFLHVPSVHSSLDAVDFCLGAIVMI